jgi:hypothetical protein
MSQRIGNPRIPRPLGCPLLLSGTEPPGQLKVDRLIQQLPLGPQHIPLQPSMSALSLRAALVVLAGPHGGQHHDPPIPVAEQAAQQAHVQPAGAKVAFQVIKPHPSLPA